MSYQLVSQAAQTRNFISFNHRGDTLPRFGTVESHT
jgi:hypothetical protein